MNDVSNDIHAQSFEGDVLSDVLQLLKLDVQIYFNAKACGNWRMADDAERGSSFHIVTQGRCQLDAPGYFQGALDEGDLVIFSRGIPHEMYPLAEMRGTQRYVDYSQGRDIDGTGLLCGDVSFQHRGSRHQLDALPPVFVVRFDQGGAWLASLLTMIMAENNSPGPASKVILNRLAELLFTYAVRQYLIERDGQVGVLALYGHVKLASAIKLIHQHPEKQWSLAQLAEVAAMSRTVFSEKFKAVSGWTVGQYLTWWRMQVAWELLQNGESVAQVAERVGYQSDAAFSRAFKKMFDLSPGRLRRGDL